MYLALMKERPELFKNTGEKNEIKIIHNPERILAEQEKIKAELRSKGLPEYWIEIGVLSEDEWFWTVRDMVEFPNGFVWGYIRQINRKVQDGGFGVILLCAREGQLLMIKKFRHEERGWSWEFPRGFGDPKLTANENAQKELLEETGLVEKKLEMLAEIKEGKGGLSVFLARIESDQKIVKDDVEGIGEYIWVSEKDIEKLILEGKIKDWFSLWAFILARSRKIF